MLEVVFHDANGPVGKVQYDGEELSCKPETERLRKVLTTPIFSARAGGKVDPKNDPELFVRHLCDHYRSPYFNAGEAETI
jgi:hypothetical protein